MASKPIELIKNSPVTAITSLEAGVAFVLTFLATHGVIPGVHSSDSVQAIAPIIAAALPGVAGAIKRQLVAPWAKVRTAVERETGMTDADFSRLGALVKDAVAEHLGADAEAPAEGEVAATEADLTTGVPTPDGMGAGLSGAEPAGQHEAPSEDDEDPEPQTDQT